MKMKKYLRQLIFIISILLIHCTIILDLSKVDSFLYLVLLSIALARKFWDMIHFCLLLLVMSANELYFPSVFNKLPSVWALAPFLMSTLLISPFRKTRTTLTWFKLGNLNMSSFFFAFFTVMISSISLLLWAFWSDNLGIGVRMFQGIAHYPKWLILLCLVPIFALVNSFAEEAVYRGVLQEALSNTFKSQAIIVGVQASAFAAAHFALGFPNGYIGYLMVFTYGCMLGYLRQRTNGIFIPVMTHGFADLTIGYFMFYFVSVQ